MPTSLDISLPLLPGESYHIYNRGNEKRTIFFQEDNFRYFLKRYHYYVKDFMDTYAYCLLDNHFHLCVKIKSSSAILKAVKTNKAFKPNRHFLLRYAIPYLKSIGFDAQEVKNRYDRSPRSVISHLPSTHSSPIFDDIIHPDSLTDLPFQIQLCSYVVSQRFRRFLISYAKSINKQQERSGSLFQKPFRRKWIATREDLKTVITYIHHNVIHHGYDQNYERNPWSSYQEYISDEPNPIICQEGLSLFGGLSEFIQFSANYKSEKMAEMEFTELSK